METITCDTWTGHLGKGLAPRELEALLGVAQGMTAKQIAQQMQITPGTVANRIENAMFKLGVARRAAAVAEAMRRQIISPLCIAIAGLIAIHAVMDEGDPMRRASSGTRAASRAGSDHSQNGKLRPLRITEIK